MSEDAGNLPFWKDWRTGALIASLAGLGVSCHLTALEVAHVVPTCGEGCLAVLTSRYSHVLGVPVAALGILFYAQSIVFLALNRPQLGFLWATLGFLAGVGLTAISVLGLHAVCKWCLGSAVSGAALFAFWGQLMTQPKQPVTPSVLLAYLCLPLVVGTAAFSNAVGGADPIAVDQKALDAVPLSDLVPADAHAVGEGPPTVIFFGDLKCAACHWWYPRFRNLTRRIHAKFVYRHFVGLANSWFLETPSEKLPADNFWDYMDAAHFTDLAGDNADFIAKWAKVGFTHDDRTAEMRIKGDILFAGKLGFKDRPTVVIVEADGTRKALSPSAAFRELSND